jgi:hypothetical protein
VSADNLPTDRAAEESHRRIQVFDHACPAGHKWRVPMRRDSGAWMWLKATDAECPTCGEFPVDDTP